MSKKQQPASKVTFNNVETKVIVLGDTVGIWEVNAEGKRVGCFPILAFQTKKIQLLHRHAQEVMAIYEETTKEKKNAD